MTILEIQNIFLMEVNHGRNPNRNVPCSSLGSYKYDPQYIATDVKAIK